MNLMTYFFSILFYIRIKLRPNSSIDGIPRVRGWVRLYGSGKIIIGKNLKLNSGIKYNPIGGDAHLFLIANERATLKIGNNVGISNSTIFCNNSIEIRNNVMIGGSVKIYDTNFHSLDAKYRSNRKKDKINTREKEVIIDEGAFIGAHSIILKGSHISKNEIIGAGSIIRECKKDYDHTSD